MPTAIEGEKDLRRTVQTIVNGAVRSSGLSWHQSAMALAYVILLVMPIVLCAIFISQNFVEIPIEDDMCFFIILKKYLAGEMTVSQVVMHRILEHRAGAELCLMYSIGQFSSFQSLSWVVGSLCFLFATAALLLIRARTLSGSQHYWLVPIAWLVFSLRQWDTLLWGTCVGITSNIFLVISALLCLERSKRFDWWFGGACVCVVLGAFSYAAALMLLPIGYLLVLLAGSKRTIRDTALKLVVWTGLSLYLFSGTSTSQNLVGIKQNILDVLILWVAALGNPLGCEPRSAIAAGIILLLVFGYCCWTMLRCGLQTVKACAFPLSLCLFWLLAAACISVGRFGAGLEVACISRYSTNLVAGVLGVYIFCLALKGRGQRHFGALSTLIVGLIIQGLIVSAISAYAEGEILHDNRVVIQNMIQNHALQSPEAIGGITFNQRLKDKGLFSFMEQHKFGLFSIKPHNASPRTSRQPIPNYLLEEINSEQVHTYPVSRAAKCRIGKDTSVQFRGYAADFSTRRPCEELKVLVGNVVIPATMGIFRKDVVKRFHKESFKGCGFVAVCDPKLIGPGTHKVVLKMRFPGQSTFVDSGQLATLQVD